MPLKLEGFGGQFTPFERAYSATSPLCRGTPHVLEKYVVLSKYSKTSFIFSWESELGIALSNKDTETVLFLAHGHSQCVPIQENHYKLLARWYRPPFWLFHHAFSSSNHLETKIELSDSFTCGCEIPTKQLWTINSQRNQNVVAYRSLWKVEGSKDTHNTLLQLTTNLTVTTGFFLLGFQGSQLLRNLLFLLFLIVYYLTLCGNLLIITLVSTSKILHTPMYFFISQLSISDIILTTNIVPNFLHVLVYNGAAITFAGCFIQFYFFGALEASECLLLSVMSYDRYVAICNPLRYASIMTNHICVKLASMCWFLGFFFSFIIAFTPSKLYFCGPNIIDHLFCDLVSLLELSCSDTFIVRLEMDIMGAPTILIPTIFIVVSYTYIVFAVLRIPSSTGRQKVFSTCGSHLIVVSIFYWTIFSVYILPIGGKSLLISKILSLLYTVFTPLMNPIIYSLRNQDIKKSVQEIIHRH
ncbi:olfactory receptor 11H4-like [Leptodactylus fuscus]|uniref:olfactory receptor 11H4-like n=1 Tax=Leptodactylus fuscus TaxID=238119 RepID=UPI003F4F1B69